MASLGPCFPKSQVCKPCPPHCQLTESGRCSYLPSTLADYGLVLQNQQCLEWICLGNHEGWNKGKWHGCSLKEEVFVVFWSCRFVAWDLVLKFVYGSTMELQMQIQWHNNLSQRAARCRLVIGKLKSRGDGEEQQLFCCIVKPWFLGPTFVQEALSELKNVRSDSRCHHSIQSASFEDQPSSKYCSTL